MKLFTASQPRSPDLGRSIQDPSIQLVDLSMETRIKFQNSGATNDGVVIDMKRRLAKLEAKRIPSLVFAAGSTLTENARDEDHRLPAGIISAVIVIVLAALGIAVTLVLWKFRRRRGGRHDSHRNLGTANSLGIDNASQRLLISASALQRTWSGRIVMNPPPRLADRKFLPSPRLDSLCQPTVESRGSPLPQQRTLSTPLSGRQSQPSATPIRSHRSRIVSIPRASTETHPPKRVDPSIKILSISLPDPASRSDTPSNQQKLTIPGPPPRRALPIPPPEYPRARGKPTRVTSLTHAPQVYGDFGVAMGIVTRNPARGVVLPPESRDLRDLTEECTREAEERNSWGSWGGGVNVGNQRIANSSRRKQERHYYRSPLSESDLEKMAGTY